MIEVAFVVTRTSEVIVAADDLEKLLAARRAAKELVSQNLSFARVEERLLAQDFDTEVTQVTMRHLMQETVTVMERNERYFRLVGFACMGFGVVVLVATTIGDQASRQGSCFQAAS